MKNHSVFIISQERHDQDVVSANLDAGDIHLHVLDQTQYPAHLLPGYSDSNLHTKVVMRADRPIALTAWRWYSTRPSTPQHGRQVVFNNTFCQ